MEQDADSHTLQVLGYLESCFTDKFGIPRQPGLAPLAQASLRLLPPNNRAEAVEGLQDCSHVWLQFVFHKVAEGQEKLSVRPPRLGGNQRRGVFATRSPFRPNRLGLSVVALREIQCTGADVTLYFSGVDLLDGTPVVDIKPYVPYVDSVSSATNAMAEVPPALLQVTMDASIQETCQRLADRHPRVDELIKQILAQDPRPSYQQLDPQREYGMRLYDLNIRWRYREVDGAVEIVVAGIDAP